MTFSLKIKKNNANQLSEVANFTIWQRVTFMDDTHIIKSITPSLIPLFSSLRILHNNNLVLKRRGERFVLYQLSLYNGLDMTIDRDVGGGYYFQFSPDSEDIANLSAIKQIEYSIDQNFTSTLINNAFRQEFTFQKLTNSTYSFFILAEDNTKYYEKLLIPFLIDAPTNSRKMVKNSLQDIQLPSGFYQIDNIKYFFDKNKEVLPAHYILKITV